MSELDRRLERGPLRVRSVWTPDPPEKLARALLARRRRAFVRNSLLAGSALACLVLFWPRSRPDPVPVASVAEPLVRTLDDGSRVELASRDVQLVLEETPQKVIARLRGSARFQVPSRAQRSFEVHTAELRVHVLAASFAMRELEPGRARVSVEQGTVEVAWQGGRALLGTGESAEFPPRQPPALASAEQTAPPPTPVAPEPRKPGPRARAADGVAQLLATADRARLSGHPELAVAPLRELCEQHPRDRRAPVAAFALGRVLLDDLARPGEAALMFRKVRTLWPGGPLVEAATAREAEAFERAGDRAGASQAARTYLVAHPEGRHAVAMRALLAGR